MTVLGLSQLAVNGYSREWRLFLEEQAIIHGAGGYDLQGIRNATLDFICPACSRGWVEIARLTSGNLWVQGANHHDHGGAYRFEETYICGNCNEIDDTAKRALAKRRFPPPRGYQWSPWCGRFYPETNYFWFPDHDIDAPVFSFSPEEIKKFVRPRPNQKHSKPGDDPEPGGHLAVLVGVYTKIYQPMFLD